MQIFLYALSLQNFRGIGINRQEVGIFQNFNFFVGTNNSGKSTILDFIARLLPRGEIFRHLQNELNFSPLDRNLNSGVSDPEFAIGIPENIFIANIKSKLDPVKYAKISVFIKRIVEYINRDGIIFIHRSGNWWQIITNSNRFGTQEILANHEWENIWSALTNKGGGAVTDWITGTFDAIIRIQQYNLPQAHLVPAIRKLGPKGETFTDFSGAGLIDRLAELQSPNYDRRDDLDIFNRINSFLQNVSGHRDAKIEIPHAREHVLVHIDERVLPLASLGTGIHEVIMLAAFCTLNSRQIICLEEPELHLHPLLQKKLVNYLKAETDNQYFIATHSASFIDTPGAAIFHVTNDGKQTYVTSAKLKNERFAICENLGYRASDILQANAVIWVEGPSDRIYIKHWLKNLAPGFSEGIHYAIMFYGGKLLSHLSVDDDPDEEAVNDLISLRPLNRNVALIMDSDKSRAKDEIGQSKKRLLEEFGKDGGIAWITAGREIENYVTHKRLQTVVKQIYSKKYLKPAEGRLYDHALFFHQVPNPTKREKSKIFKNIDKVKVARLVCEEPAELDVLDLRERLEELVELISRAN